MTVPISLSQHSLKFCVPGVVWAANTFKNMDISFMVSGVFVKESGDFQNKFQNYACFSSGRIPDL